MEFGIFYLSYPIRRDNEITLRHKEDVVIRLPDESSTTILYEYLCRLIPRRSKYSIDEDYRRVYKKYEDQGDQIKAVFNLQTRLFELQYNISLLNYETFLQMDIIHRLTNHNVWHPETIFLDGVNLKIILKYTYYKTIDKYILENKTRSVYYEKSLRVMAVRLIHILRDLEELGVQLNSFEDVLFPNANIEKVILGTLRNISKIGKVRHCRMLGYMLHKMVFGSADPKQLRQWLAGKIPNYCLQLRMFSRALFEFIIYLIDGDRASSFIRATWLIDKNRLHAYRSKCKLPTIQSNFGSEESALEKEHSEDSEDCYLSEDYEGNIKELVEGHQLEINNREF